MLSKEVSSTIFESLVWLDFTWDWTLVFRTIGKHLVDVYIVCMYIYRQTLLEKYLSCEYTHSACVWIWENLFIWFNENISKYWKAQTKSSPYIQCVYVYIYIYMCLCVCVYIYNYDIVIFCSIILHFMCPYNH